MGLDSFASRTPDEITLTPEDKAVFAALDLRICEWIGTGSFRGKVYEILVLTVADEYLHQDWLPPETVLAIAARLAWCDYDGLGERYGLDDMFMPSREEFESLQQYFRVCAERGLGLVGLA